MRFAMSCCSASRSTIPTSCGCTRLVENPASDLLELDGGTLVPVQFVVSHTPNDKIHVDAPVGLFDLDEAASERDQD